MFPPDEDPEYVKLVRERLPLRLSYLEGFFFKKAFIKLLSYRLRYDVILELKYLRTGLPPTYRTPIKHIPLEKETIDELLYIGFIERYMEFKAVPVLFILKLYVTEKRFYIDFR